MSNETLYQERLERIKKAIHFEPVDRVPGCDAPVNTKPENMKAFSEAAHEFGVVK